MNKKGIIALVIIIIVIIVALVLAKRSDKEMMVGDTTVDQTVQTDNNVPSDTSATPVNDSSVSVTVDSGTNATVTTFTPKEFTVTSSNYAFAPKTMTVKKGDIVKITLANSGGTHDLKIDEFNVATKRVSGTEKDTITFVADKTGTFQYYCSVGSHRAMGMWGTLTVTE